MSVPFVNHHAHTHFSTLDGYSKPDEYAQRAAELGQTSITVTDHGTLAGIPQMYKAAKKAGLGFTPGIEAYFTQNRKYKQKDKLGSNYYHLILLAYNYEGYENLAKMQTPSWEEGFHYKPRVDYEILDQYSNGLIATTACLGGIVNQLLLRGDYEGAIKETQTLVDIFGKENVYVELQRHGIEDQERILGQQVQIAKDLNLKLLATNDSHYTHGHESDIHDTLLCCSAGTKHGIVGSKYQTERMSFDGDNLNYLHSGEQMLELFPESEFPGAVTNSMEIAEKTDFHMPVGEDNYILPKVPTEGKTEAQALYDHVMEGAADPKRYGDGQGNIPDYVKERIEGELKVINDMGFPGYFLIVENFVKLFAEKGIYVGHGRGCLHKDTEVLTDKGWRKIKSIKPGYKVIDSRGQISTVLERPMHTPYEGEEFVELTNEENEKILLTEKHKVLTMDKHGNSQWVSAGRIKPGDNVVSVTGTDSTKFHEINPNERGKQLESAEWGYILGTIISRGRTWNDRVMWKFGDDDQDVAETLVSCLNSVFTSPPVVEYDGYNIAKAVVFSDDLASWARNLRRKKDIFIGHGSKGFSKGFLQSFQSVYSSPVNSTNEITADTRREAEIVWGSTVSLGLEASVDGQTVLIDSVNKSRTQKVHTVINVDSVPIGEDYIYDLIIEGDPSFLTKFSTVHNSAPGSVVVYCLGITNVDPFRHNLFFERFLNPDRISMPDIDIDVPKTKRQEALAILEEEYGRGHVAQITNYSAMKDKEALNSVSKVYGFSPSEAARFKEAVDEYCSEHKTTLQEIAESGVVPDEINKKSADRTKSKIILEQAAKLSGTIKSYGVHACGIVITTEPVDHHFPVRYKMGKDKKPEGLPICQYDGHDVEDLGGVKMDLLGLINLDEAEDAERNILQDLGEEVDTSDLPLDDPEVYQMLSEGRGGGIFQLGCLSGDTVVEGKKIKHWYQLRNSVQKLHMARSVFMGMGNVGMNKVEKVVYSGKKKTLKLTLVDKSSIACTPDHHIFTQRGWIKAGEINPDEDMVLKVLDNTYGENPYIRGKQDIFDMAQAILNSGSVDGHDVDPDTGNQWVEIEKEFPYSYGGETFYPHFHRYGNYKHAVLIYPDDYPEPARRAFDKMNAVDNASLIIMSHSEVVEQYYNLNPLDADDITPNGTKLVAVSSVEDGEVIDTYDMMMRSPVNNFIANGMMVHNSTGIQELMRLMRPTNFEDISALVALYRPGPMGMKTHVNYAKYKNDPNESAEFLHPDMEEILKNTHGLVVYQEDIMALSRKFAGYTGAEADTLRKATAKKIPEMMKEQKRKFIPAVKKNHPDYKDLGQGLWDIIAPFAEYAFNKSHSAAYAMLAYRTAWLKVHYPAQFSGACIDYNLSNKDDLLDTISWIKGEGIKINYPNVNVSETRTVTSEDSITLSLDIIAGLGDNKAIEIINEREQNGEYTSVIDFLARNKIPKSLLVNIIKAGALDGFGHERAVLMHSIDKLIDSSSQKKSRNIIMMDSLFGDIIDDNDDSDMVDLDITLESIDDGHGNMVPVDESLYSMWERETLRFIIGPHPFGLFREMEKAQDIIKRYRPIDEFKKPVKEARCSGIITNVTKRVSKRGKPYSTFDLETDVLVAPGIVFDQPVGPSADGMTVIIDGSIEDANDDSGAGSRTFVDENGNEQEAELEFRAKILANKIRPVRVDKMKEQE